MIILPAVEQWANAYTFSTAGSTGEDPSNFDTEDYMVMVCPADQVSGLLFDGQVLYNLYSSWLLAYDMQYTICSLLNQT